VDEAYTCAGCCERQLLCIRSIIYSRSVQYFLLLLPTIYFLSFGNKSAGLDSNGKKGRKGIGAEKVI
jgi:hypothetical protein